MGDVVALEEQRLAGRPAGRLREAVALIGAGGVMTLAEGAVGVARQAGVLGGHWRGLDREVYDHVGSPRSSYSKSPWSIVSMYLSQRARLPSVIAMIRS